MGDGSAEGSFLGLLRIDVDPLVVVSGVGEGVDAFQEEYLGRCRAALDLPGDQHPVRSRRLPPERICVERSSCAMAPRFPVHHGSKPVGGGSARSAGESGATLGVSRTAASGRASAPAPGEAAMHTNVRTAQAG